MLKSFKNRLENRTLFFWTYLLVLIGLLILFSASKGVLAREGLFLKQCLWLVGATVIAVFVKRVDYRDMQKIAPVLYLLLIPLLVGVLYVGKTGGASRWIRLGWLTIQPAEFAKLITIIALAAYFTDKDVKRLPVLLAGLFITGIPFLLILKQPDLGTAFLFILIFFAILYQAGGSKAQILTLMSIGIFSTPVLWFFLKSYQRERILTFLNPMSDPLGKGYNLIQSIITIGSGGFWGKGFLRGPQTKLAFLPEYHTDFIFCVLAEEMGFFGVLILLAIYFMFLRTIAGIIYSTSDRFARLLATGILVVFVSHVVINISMTMGLFPVVGIPLPFISYGGSSLLVFLLSVVLLVNIKENSVIF